MREPKARLLWSAIAVCGLALVCVQAAAGAEGFDTIVIDPGHGGDDAGARGASGHSEKDLVLDISRRLKRRLEARGLKVVLTRTGDRFLDLAARPALANAAHADLFLSIHANAAASSRVVGVETFFLSLDASDEASRRLAERENRSGSQSAERGGVDPLERLLHDLKQNETLRESDVLARYAEAELADLGPNPSRGVKQAPFAVLMGTRMPSVLVEVGFISNPAEARSLARPQRREAIAGALARAVLAYGARFDSRSEAGRHAREETGYDAPAQRKAPAFRDQLLAVKEPGSR